MHLDFSVAATVVSTVAIILTFVTGYGKFRSAFDGLVVESGHLSKAIEDLITEMRALKDSMQANHNDHERRLTKLEVRVDLLEQVKKMP